MHEARSQAPLPVPVAPEFLQGIGTQAVPGLAPGSRRYNVVFKKRGFNMAIFYRAISSGQTAETVEAHGDEVVARRRADTRNATPSRPKATSMATNPTNNGAAVRGSVSVETISVVDEAMA